MVVLVLVLFRSPFAMLCSLYYQNLWGICAIYFCKCKQLFLDCSQLIIALTIWYKALISSHLFLRTLSITDSRVTPTVLTMESTVVSLTSQPARGSLIFRIWSMMSLVSGLEFLVVQGWLTTVSMLNLLSGSITNKPCNDK